MTARLRQLEQRQRALVLRSDLQRRALADEGLAIGARLDGVERKVALGRQLLSWPALGAGALALLAFAGPRRALRLASRVLVFATLARRAYGLVGASALRPARPASGAGPAPFAEPSDRPPV